ncbi:MAG: hypothetical protein D6720_11220 [Gammaproteobacteria bacterium]|nr:MAG: hypothetical protein D6720_11220 [Gammaproteobacteria bacterium]
MRCYAVRQLNPFSGMLQVVEGEAARAYSANGSLWRIQVLAERPDHTWRSSNEAASRQYFNWGLWSRHQGMHRVTANPILDIGTMQRIADELVAILPDLEARLPFAPRDRFEYWACDHTGRPVALIGSALHLETANGTPDTRWRATAIGDHDFVSRTLLEAGTPTHDGFSPRTHAEHLESAVRHRAQARHWFERLADGSGQRLDNRQILPAERFPPLGLATDWDDLLMQGLAEDYLAWLAPMLLVLPGITDSERARLERAAIERALVVADFHRLYPKVISPSLIERALVEARLRRAHRGGLQTP